MPAGAVTIRLSKVVMTAGLSLWAALVTLGNVANVDSYLPFVQHVLSMDTIFADSVFSWRAITNPAVVSRFSRIEGRRFFSH